MTLFSKPWVRRSLLGIVLLTTLLAAGLFWALRTENGARHIIGFAVAGLDANVSLGGVNGTVARGLTFSDLALVSDAATIDLDTVVLEVDTAALLSRSLSIRSLDITGVTIVLTGSEVKSSPEPNAAILPPKIDLPIDIAIDQLRVSNVRLGQEKGQLNTVIESVQAKAALIGTDFELIEFSTKSPFGTLSATATVSTEGAYPVLLVAESMVLLPDMASLHSSTRLSGSLEALEVQHSSRSPYEVRIEGLVTQPLAQPDLKLQVGVIGIDVQQMRDSLPDIRAVGELKLSGLLDNLAIAGNVSGSLPTVGQTGVSFDGTIMTRRLQISSLVIELPEVENKPEVRASGDVIVADEGPIADIRLDWSRLRWPLQGDSVVSSQKGSATLEGTPDAYTVALLGKISTPQESNGEIEVAAQGTPGNLNVNSLRLQALKGIITGRGELSTTDGLAFVASLKGTGIDPGSLDTDWPGKLDFTLAGSGTATDQGVSAMVEKMSGKGQLRGYQVAFDGSGRVEPNLFDIERFNVTTGDTVISASGEVAERINLDWSLESSDLNALWPGLQGQAKGQGKAGGTPSQPTVTFTLFSEELEYKGMTAKAIEANVAYDGASTNSTMSLIATDLTQGAYESERLAVEARGALDTHSIVIGIEDGLGETSAVIEGRLTESGQYDFDLEQLNVATSDLGVWSLAKPAFGRASSQAVTVSETCLAQDQSTLCLSLDAAWNRVAAKVDIARVPLSLVSYLIPSTVRARGIINGGGDIVVSAEGDSSGRVHFELDPLIFESRFRKDTRDSTLRFNASTLTASIDEAGELELAASFPLTSGGGLDFDGRIVAGQEALLERSLSGNLSLSVPSVAFVTDYIPQLSQVEGQIDGVVQLAGSLRYPELLGSFGLEKGALTLADPGVQVTDLSLRLAGNRNSSFTLTGAASSGGGNISMDGVLELNDEGNKGRFDLEGTSFQVLNTHESQVWASPDVSLEYQDKQLSLNGTVVIPKAKVEIDALPTGTSKVSQDQVIVGQSESNGSSGIPLRAELVLQLGDDVHLSAFGLDAFLDGAITLRETDSKPTTATGEIELREGEYQAYGQRLTITTGRLIYAGGPLDQPGIDLRAIRRPAAGIEVGISARGTISQPTFSVFSEPAMSDSDQLAYLIFGRPINAEATSESSLITRAALTLGMRGGEAITQKLADDLGVDQLGIESQGSGDLSQASLVIGKYLSPKLFVSYGIGLLEPVSTLKLEYALSSRWNLISESSSTRTSADVQYTIER